jgi:ribosome-associated protein
MTSPLFVDPRVTIPGGELSWTAVRSGGPGGQNVNKVASKVELRFDLPGTRAFSPEVKARLRVIAAGKLDAEGRILLTSQRTRDQVKNLADAREKLAELVRRALFVPKARRATKPSRGSKERRLEGKRHDARTKASRGKVGDD